jgi:hypothetical protein
MARRCSELCLRLLVVCAEPALQHAAFRGAQMDAYGNVNNTTIGPYESPKVARRGGMADLSCMIPPSTSGRRPTTANVVERPRLPLGIGWGDGGDTRAARSVAAAALVTNLCVSTSTWSRSDADPQPAPGVAVEQVVEAPPALATPEATPVTDQPTRELRSSARRSTDRRPLREFDEGRRPIRKPVDALGATDVIEADAPTIRESPIGSLGCRGAEAARLLFDWARRDRVRHGTGGRLARGLAGDRDADRGRGFCQQKAVLLAALLRARGIPPESCCRTCSITRSRRTTSRSSASAPRNARPHLRIRRRPLGPARRDAAPVLRGAQAIPPR